MKKIILSLSILMVVFLLTSLTFAEDNSAYPTRKIFDGKGEIQRFVDFKFEVPFGTCGQTDTYQYVRYYGWGTPGHWEKKTPGTVTDKGWYRFVNKDAGACLSKFTIQGNLDFLERMEGWYVMELEPDEIGLFVKGKWSGNNYFRLSTNDRLYSYYLVAPSDEMSTSLEIFFGENNNFIYMNGTSVGVIVADSRGFLKQVVWKNSWIARSEEVKNMVFRDDDIIILIYQENYR